MAHNFEELEHTGDVAIRVWGTDLAGLFASAAVGMAHQLANPATVECTISRDVELNAGDVETLLVSWLGELLYLGERDGADGPAVFLEFAIAEIVPNHLRAVARGGPAGENRRHIKAVTFSDLAVRYTENGYETVIVFDV